MGIDSTLPNFRALSPAERLAHLAAKLELSDADQALLAKPGALPLATADGMIENVIGTFELPLGVAGNFIVNGREVLVPMVVVFDARYPAAWVWTSSRCTRSPLRTITV